MIDLFGTTGEFHVGQGIERHKLPHGGRDGHCSDKLRTISELLFADQREVDFFAFEEVIAHVGAIDQRIDRETKFRRTYLHFRGLQEFRFDVNFGARQVEARNRSGLTVRDHPHHLAEDLPAKLHEPFHFGAGNLDVDRAARRDSLLKQARLLALRRLPRGAFDLRL